MLEHKNGQFDMPHLPVLQQHTATHAESRSAVSLFRYKNLLLTWKRPELEAEFCRGAALQDTFTSKPVADVQV